MLRGFVIDYTSPDQRVLVEQEEGGTGFNYQNMYGINKLSVKVTSEGIDWWGQAIHEDVMKAYTHTDRLGSTVNLTDDYGRVTTRVQYSEWGDLLSTDPITIKHGFRAISPQNNYTGHEYDDVLGMYYAITRVDETTGKTLSKGDESKVTPIQALIMWTKNSAFFSHDDDKMGSVEVGNLADFAILDRDCFASSDPTDIRDAKVTTTVLGGKVVYEA